MDAWTDGQSAIKVMQETCSTWLKVKRIKPLTFKGTVINGPNTTVKH